MSKKTIAELREEADRAAQLYKDHPSPWLFNKARLAKLNLNKAIAKEHAAAMSKTPTGNSLFPK